METSLNLKYEPKISHTVSRLKVCFQLVQPKVSCQQMTWQSWEKGWEGESGQKILIFLKKIYKSENNSCPGSMYNSNQGGGGWAAIVKFTNKPIHQVKWEDVKASQSPVLHGVLTDQFQRRDGWAWADFQATPAPCPWASPLAHTQSTAWMTSEAARVSPLIGAKSSQFSVAPFFLPQVKNIAL